MDTMQFRYLISVAEQRSFTAAAAQFKITQPTICRQISALEEELGVRLLTRSSHGVTLTTAGLECLEYANQLLELEEQALSDIVSISQGRSGKMRLAVSPIAVGILERCLGAFAEQYPNIQVDIDMLTNVYALENGDTASYDFFFTSDAFFSAHFNLDHLCCQRDRFHFLVHKKDLPLVSGQDFSALAHRPFLTVNRLSEAHLFEKIMTICRARGFVPKLSGHHSHLRTALIAVNAGFGITILPLSAIGGLVLDHLTALPIEGEDAAVNIVIAWRRSSANLATERFLEVVQTLYPNERAF